MVVLENNVLKTNYITSAMTGAMSDTLYVFVFQNVIQKITGAKTCAMLGTMPGALHVLVFQIVI